MECGSQKKSKNTRLIFVILTAYSLLASSGLVFQQFHVQNLQFDLDHANDVVATQDYKTGGNWARLLCSEKQGINPDKVLAAWHIADLSDAVDTTRLQCAAGEDVDAKTFDIIERN